ncbi:MAG: hypothetical protein K8S87_12040 [Planctomycetes bacterium]|nr:hypothetical protein [Planctomycetota bacterium]
MTFYPLNFKKGERLNEYELYECTDDNCTDYAEENKNILTFSARDTNSNLLLSLEIPVSDAGNEIILQKRYILNKIKDIPYVRKLIPQKSFDSSNNLLALELLPPENLRKHIENKGKFQPEKLGEIVCQLLTLAKNLQNMNIELPKISVDNIYISASKIIVDYANPVTFDEFVADLAKIIALITENEKLAKILIEQLPVDEGNKNFKHVKARIISIIGGKAENQNFSLDEATVKCPECGTEYVLSANVCKKCNINLLTGTKLDAGKTELFKRKKAGSSKISALVILGALVSVFAVFSKALGISWMLWTLITGVAFVVLVIIFLIVMGT